MSRISFGVFAIIAFGFGFAVQQTTKSGSRYCWPHSWFQEGHAIWHVCAGLGCLFTFFFFLSEKFTFQRREGELEEDDLDEFIDNVHLDLISRGLLDFKREIDDERGRRDSEGVFINENCNMNMSTATKEILSVFDIEQQEETKP